jgi:5'-nucleotidase
LRPLILICNDDGIYSPGIHALAQAVAPLGDLLIAAPRLQQTAMGRAKAPRPDGGIIEQLTLNINGEPHPAYGIHATPALCIVHAMTEIADRKPDLCLTGINYGENVGFSLTASGTIGAALEAASFGVPSIAVSLETPLEINFLNDYAPLEWDIAAHFAARFAAQVLDGGLPDGIAMLNINVPSDATLDTAVKYTFQSRQNYYWFDKQKPRDFAAPFYPKETKYAAEADLEPGSDVMAVVYERAVSVTPFTGILSAGVEAVEMMA